MGRIRYLYFLHRTAEDIIEDCVRNFFRDFPGFGIIDIEKGIKSIDINDLANYKDIIVMVCL